MALGPPGRRGGQVRIGEYVVRRPGRLGAPLAGGLAFLLLLGAVGLGLRVPGLSLLFPFGKSPKLDYSAGPFRAIAPLREAFIADVLGEGALEPPRVLGASFRRLPARSPEERKRVVLSHPPTNDDFEDAVKVSSVPFTAKTNTASAGREPGEPTGCAPVGSGTLWYRYAPERDWHLSADTFGSDFPTVVAVYVGTTLNSLESLGCGADPRGNAQVSFRAQAAKSYYFQVGDAAVGGANLVFNLGRLGTTTRVSTSSAGEGGNGSYSGDARITPDGRYLAFSSDSSNLVDGDLNASSDVFVRDMALGTTNLVSVSSSGDQGISASRLPAISANGRYVAFSSMASNLVAGDTNACVRPRAFYFSGALCRDVFVHDRVAGSTSRVSVSSSGKQADGDSGSGLVSMSADGRYVAFESDATNLVPDDTNACVATRVVLAGFGTGTPCRDVFVHDRLTHATTRVSVSSSGEQGDEDSDSPHMSADGRYVFFTSRATNLVRGDTNGTWDAFLHDRLTRATSRVSVSPSGEQGDSFSFAGALSSDGRFLVFISSASNFAPGDTNDTSDVFVYDRVTRVITRVSVSSSGEGGDAASFSSSISSDGRYVAFDSSASNLVAGDTNNCSYVIVSESANCSDIFVRDLVTGVTTRVSVSSTGEQADDYTEAPAISADGRYVAFEGDASNLAPGDMRFTTDVFVHDRTPDR